MLHAQHGRLHGRVLRCRQLPPFLHPQSAACTPGRPRPGTGAGRAWRHGAARSAQQERPAGSCCSDLGASQPVSQPACMQPRSRPWSTRPPPFASPQLSWPPTHLASRGEQGDQTHTAGAAGEGRVCARGTRLSAAFHVARTASPAQQRARQGHPGRGQGRRCCYCCCCQGEARGWGVACAPGGAAIRALPCCC